MRHDKAPLRKPQLPPDFRSPDDLPDALSPAEKESFWRSIQALCHNVLKIQRTLPPRHRVRATLGSPPRWPDEAVESLRGLDERRRPLLVEAVQDAAPVRVEPARPPTKRKRGGQRIVFRHIDEVLDTDLRRELMKNPNLSAKEQVNTVVHGLAKRGVKVADHQCRTIGNRIRDSRTKKPR